MPYFHQNEKYVIKIKRGKWQSASNRWIGICSYRVFNNLVLKVMKKYLKSLVLLIFCLNFSFVSNAKEIPASFADLAERLMPSVVNISTTTTITTRSNPFPFQFPPGSPFEDMFKDFGTPQERKTSALGSGFIISDDGIVITNNHVIQGAEDVFVRVNGDQEFKA